jgi:DNA (cytosine-5)-methyltransferase 1
MYELALYAGAAGGLLASKWLLGWRTVCYVEYDAFCIEVLKARIRDGLLDNAPIWDDARTFDGRPWRGCVDIVTAGFPCQPFSAAGRQLAGDDPRNMWPDTVRILREVRPRWAFLENVPTLLAGSHGYFGRVQQDLAEIGYAARWDCIPASAVGADHRRDRLWIVVHPTGG